MKRVSVVILVVFLVTGFFLIKKKSNGLDVVPLPGRQYFDTLALSFEKAKKSIIIVMFEFFLTNRGGRGPDSLLTLLKNASKRGVEVKVLLEGGEKHLGGKFKSRIEETAQKLSERGIKVYLEKEGITTHAKITIVDGKEVFLGSTNWSYYGLNKNNESNVLIRSKKLAKFFEEYAEKILENSIAYTRLPNE